MTENKRFELKLCSTGTYYVYENGTLTDIDFDKFNKESADALIDEVNALYDENEELKDALNQRTEQCDKNYKENKELKKALDDFKTYDDEDFRETEYINSIYKEDGFNGVIDYAKRNLCQYGLVKEVQEGLWVMVTGGWSDNEFWLHCLNHPISIFHMKHYCAYERGGAFYYTEKPHDKIEIRLKGDVE